MWFCFLFDVVFLSCRCARKDTRTYFLRIPHGFRNYRDFAGVAGVAWGRYHYIYTCVCTRVRLTHFPRECVFPFHTRDIRIYYYFILFYLFFIHFHTFRLDKSCGCACGYGIGTPADTRTLFRSFPSKRIDLLIVVLVFTNCDDVPF